ncbi:ubiquitin-conjugating protein DMA2 [Sugiyamaella lignohabitans]|uniref:Ubiquitin-conjugating protein DMA2 n=1 Tax=Sugiyamaella lignohabitans TaxID=796027 RepID=A0A161HFG3_9ASCO|nr:ubiquitin-conjugating protein DMA2 [Sugiyamaella lignohabitans]ANB11261.1 ubiquitin-conjugating protein DMA2 [Sugiyamaella lignohabitans]
MIRQIRPLDIQSARLTSSDTISVPLPEGSSPMASPSSNASTPTSPVNDLSSTLNANSINNNNGGHYATLVNAPAGLNHGEPGPVVSHSSNITNGNSGDVTLNLFESSSGSTPSSPHFIASDSTTPVPGSTVVAGLGGLGGPRGSISNNSNNAGIGTTRADGSRDVIVTPTTYNASDASQTQHQHHQHTHSRPHSHSHSRSHSRSLSYTHQTQLEQQEQQQNGSQEIEDGFPNQIEIPSPEQMQVLSQVHASDSSTPSPDPAKYPYSIRLSPFVDHSSSMPAFYTGAVEREGRDGTVIKIGRFDNKRDQRTQGDENPHVSPIVFKSKVVSRSHAEFLVKDGGQWFVRDVRSSSGTFLNHIRLSLASEESRPFALKDGDVLQLGVDFRGGLEEAFKCIKVRVELNRSWQKKPNNFNISQLTNLRNLFTNPPGRSDDTADASGSKTRHENTQECAICLLPVSACQSLFIAPCSHSWHYKCIRPVIVKAYPHFLCPNCRAICDLEAEIEVPDLSHLEISQPSSTNGTNSGAANGSTANGINTTLTS